MTERVSSLFKLNFSFLLPWDIADSKTLDNKANLGKKKKNKHFYRRHSFLSSSGETKGAPEINHSNRTIDMNPNVPPQMVSKKSCFWWAESNDFLLFVSFCFLSGVSSLMLSPERGKSCSHSPWEWSRTMRIPLMAKHFISMQKMQHYFFPLPLACIFPCIFIRRNCFVKSPPRLSFPYVHTTCLHVSDRASFPVRSWAFYLDAYKLFLWKMLTPFLLAVQSVSDQVERNARWRIAWKVSPISFHTSGSNKGVFWYSFNDF